MSSVLTRLYDHELWTDYLSEFRQRNRFRKEICDKYEDYITGKIYTGDVEAILQGEYRFSYPAQSSISKFNSRKKRIIFSYPVYEQLILKIINRILQEYQGPPSPLCYSFQRDRGVKTAFHHILSDTELNNKYCIHLDIKDYFNSIDVKLLLNKLPESIKDDSILHPMLKKLLHEERVISGNRIIINKSKGVMAGTPLSPLLSNYYLTDLDEYFRKRGITYARYSDDIILFTRGENISEYLEYIKKYLKINGLELNEKKTRISEQGKPWSFLGFSYNYDKIDLSNSSVDKLKGKIYRAAKNLNRYRSKNSTSVEKTAEIMIRKFNRKFYGMDTDDKIFSWAKWFFPLIDTDVSLKKLDAYMQDNIRFAATGRYNRRNYKEIPYLKLTESGYIPLVSAYYMFRYDNVKYRKITGGHQP